MSVLGSFLSFRARFSPTPTVRGNDGYPVWDKTKVAGAIPGMPTSPTDFVLTLATGLTANAGVADAVLGVDEWDWYLSQKSDDPARQYLKLAQPLAAKSGSVTIVTTALCTTKCPLITTDNINRVCTDVYLYALRKSDGAIFYADFMRSVFAQY